MLTARQREWVEAQLHLLRDMPEKKAPVPEHPHRRRLHALVSVSILPSCPVLLHAHLSLSSSHNPPRMLLVPPPTPPTPTPPPPLAAARAVWTLQPAVHPPVRRHSELGALRARPRLGRGRAPPGASLWLPGSAAARRCCSRQQTCMLPPTGEFSHSALTVFAGHLLGYDCSHRHILPRVAADGCRTLPLPVLLQRLELLRLCSVLGLGAK